MFFFLGKIWYTVTSKTVGSLRLVLDWRVLLFVLFCLNKSYKRVIKRLYYVPWRSIPDFKQWGSEYSQQKTGEISSQNSRLFKRMGVLVSESKFIYMYIYSVKTCVDWYYLSIVILMYESWVRIEFRLIL